MCKNNRQTLLNALGLSCYQLFSQKKEERIKERLFKLSIHLLALWLHCKRFLSKDKKINKALKWFDSGFHDTLKLTTDKGYSLTGSKNHPLLTLNKDKDGKPVFIWKLLQNISKGDVVVLGRVDCFPTVGPSGASFRVYGGAGETKYLQVNISYVRSVNIAIGVYGR